MNPVDLAKKAMKNPIEGSILNEIKKFSKSLVVTKDKKEKLTTSQLRKFFGHLRSLQQKMLSKDKTSLVSPEDKQDIEFLKIYIAYSAARADSKNTKLVDLYQFVDTAIKQIKTYSDFLKFVKVMEAIVAFHKVAEKGLLLDVEISKN